MKTQNEFSDFKFNKYLCIHTDIQDMNDTILVNFTLKINNKDYDSKIIQIPSIIEDIVFKTNSTNTFIVTIITINSIMDRYLFSFLGSIHNNNTFTFEFKKKEKIIKANNLSIFTKSNKRYLQTTKKWLLYYIN